MKITATEPFVHDRQRYEAGDHDVSPALGHYFVAQGWASDDKGNTGPRSSQDVALDIQSGRHDNTTQER